jgi:hypothetical protein
VFFFLLGIAPLQRFILWRRIRFAGKREIKKARKPEPLSQKGNPFIS